MSTNIIPFLIFLRQFLIFLNDNLISLEAIDTEGTSNN